MPSSSIILGCYVPLIILPMWSTAKERWLQGFCIGPRTVMLSRTKSEKYETICKFLCWYYKHFCGEPIFSQLFLDFLDARWTPCFCESSQVGQSKDPNSWFHRERTRVFCHLRSHGRPSPHWSARMSPFGLEPHNTNPRIHCNRVGGWGGSKVSQQSNRSKRITAIHNPFTHSHYLHSTLKLPLTHLSITVRVIQCRSRPSLSTSHSLRIHIHTHTHRHTLAWTCSWLHPLSHPELKL